MEDEKILLGQLFIRKMVESSSHDAFSAHRGLKGAGRESIIVVGLWIIANKNGGRTERDTKKQSVIGRRITEILEEGGTRGITKHS